MHQHTQRKRADQRPVLVLISGMPATGKSTLAAELSKALDWPLFTKDGFKELLFDSAGFREEDFDEDASERIGAQSIALLLDIAKTLVESGVDVILEGNFRADLAASQFSLFLRSANVRHVYCDLDTERVLDRYEERLENGERHPVHVDTEDVEELEQELELKDYRPLPLPVPALMVDTSDGFDPPIEEIVKFCRKSAPEG